MTKGERATKMTDEEKSRTEAEQAKLKRDYDLTCKWAYPLEKGSRWAHCKANPPNMNQEFPIVRHDCDDCRHYKDMGTENRDCGTIWQCQHCEYYETEYTEPPTPDPVYACIAMPGDPIPTDKNRLACSLFKEQNWWK